MSITSAINSAVRSTTRATRHAAPHSARGNVNSGVRAVVRATRSVSHGSSARGAVNSGVRSAVNAASRASGSRGQMSSRQRQQIVNTVFSTLGAHPHATNLSVNKIADLVATRIAPSGRSSRDPIKQAVVSALHQAGLHGTQQRSQSVYDHFAPEWVAGHGNPPDLPPGVAPKVRRNFNAYVSKRVARGTRHTANSVARGL